MPPRAEKKKGKPLKLAGFSTNDRSMTAMNAGCNYGDVPMTSQSKNHIRFPASPLMVFIAAAILLTMTSVRSVEMQAKKPYDRDTLLRVVQLNALPTSEVVSAIQQRGVDFQMTSDLESRFRGDCADQRIIATGFLDFAGDLRSDSEAHAAGFDELFDARRWYAAL